ncbi:hypothetical protein KTR9_2424 [Gordonia sp. KTR9]|nr:hypothetical protein KTR9_2424 [Gordonia sp. KTR9]
MILVQIVAGVHGTLRGSSLTLLAPQGAMGGVASAPRTSGSGGSSREVACQTLRGSSLALLAHQGAVGASLALLAPQGAVGRVAR